MKIIQLTAENIKKLTVVEIKPDGNMVQITGKNGQGKTSVLDSIWWALCGTENVQKQPIRAGQEAARIELQLGKGDTVELIVERRFTEKGAYLDVKTADGAKYPKPQKMLDDLIGAIAFDPLAFMREEPKGQFEILRSLVNLSIDPAELDRQNTADFAKRTDVNRTAKAKRAAADAIAVPEGLPDATIDVNEILNRMASASDHNATIERKKTNREAAEREITTSTATADQHEAVLAADIQRMESECDARVADYQKQIDALNARIETEKNNSAMNITAHRQHVMSTVKGLRDKAAGLRKGIDDAGELPEPIDVTALRGEVESAQETNRGIQARADKAALVAEADAAERESDALTAAMDARKKQKMDAIAQADMPVPGLGFGDGFVTFNGVPLEQASDAEQLIVSTSIAAAANPKLRVLRIRDGSLLDSDALVNLAKFADERDFQIWIETVQSNSPAAIEMVDGHINENARRDPPRTSMGNT